MSLTGSTSTISYKYYLANGTYVEYILSPDSRLIDVIDRIALEYFDACTTSFPKEALMRPELVSLLNKECASRFSIMLRSFEPIGMQVMKIETVVGPVIITAVPNLEFPIFIGSEQELKDNSFNTSMEKILCE